MRFVSTRLVGGKYCETGEEEEEREGGREEEEREHLDRDLLFSLMSPTLINTPAGNTRRLNQVSTSSLSRVLSVWTLDDQILRRCFVVR